MPDQTLPPASVQRYYDRLGSRYDWFEAFEGRAKQRARVLLDLSPGLSLLNAGAGTGKEHAHLARLVAPAGRAVAVDLSLQMARLARARSASPLYQADARLLPFAPGIFDRVYAAYVLDLLSAVDISRALAEFWRVLKPGGRVVLLALTEGVDLPSRALTTLWKQVFAISPVACGGCRPLQLSGSVQSAGFSMEHREVIIQLALPSELIVASKGDTPPPDRQSAAVYLTSMPAPPLSKAYVGSCADNR